MRKIAMLAAVTCLVLAGSPAFGQVIYDNGSTVPGSAGFMGLVTNPGGGGGGLDASAATPPDTTFGFSSSAGFRLADDFVVPAGQTWTITSARGAGYQTNAVTTPVVTATLAFYNGAPNAGGTIIGGDTTTNVLTSSVFSNVYRVTNTTLTNTAREVFDNTMTLGVPLVLGPGTYWIEYGYTFLNGATTTGFTPPITLAGAPTGASGNALQFNAGAYANMTDAGSTFQKALPFLIQGTVTVPEPTSMALVGLGLAGFGWRRLRKK